MIEKFIKNIVDGDSKTDINQPFIIFDIGSRDCVQSIEFYQSFPNAQIYAFECNPNTINMCKENIKNYTDRITLIDGAVTDYDGEITFYPIDQYKTQTSWNDGNPGASSIFKSNGNYDIEKYVQYEIKTKCHRLDTIMKLNNIHKVDIIWMDLQGAELLALKGLGKYLQYVKYIHTEVSHKEIYEGQVMYKELNDFILSNDFIIKNNLSMTGWQEDAIYQKISDLKKYEKKVYSQNNEDGITIELIKRIFSDREKDNNRYYVEFGTQDGSQCNTRILRENYGWTGLLMDGSYSNDYINLKKEFITRENIVSLFEKYNTPKHVNLLSIDIDFNDFHVLYQLLKKGYTFDIIILEYNAYFLPNEDAIVKYGSNMMWDSTNYFGASLLSFKKLLNKFNYGLVYTESMGVNAFFVSEKYREFFNVYDDINLLYNNPKYGTGPRGGHIQDSLNRSYITTNDIFGQDNEVFDIVICLGSKDRDIINNQIEYTKKNVIGYRNIYVVSYDPNFNIDGCITINENIFPFSIQTVNDIHGVLDRNGWYLQQLFKLYAGITIPNILNRYLVIDSDTFFIRPVKFIENGKCLYNYGDEYNVPYFTHMKCLDSEFTKVFDDKSGICHHMIFETKYIKEIFKRIETNHNDVFYNVFLKKVNLYYNSSASEYEIYFNYIFKYHADSVKIRDLKWINSDVLDMNSDNDYISYHWWMRQ
jgi:FkbM family methyltransferase